jgi:glycosyltransferase involved in cell wall biosynthesis
VCILSSQAFSLYNFRGPLIRELVGRGMQVYALAPDYDRTSRDAVIALGAEPVSYSLSRAGMNPVRDLSDAIRLALLLKRMAPDLVFSYFIKPVIYGTLAAALAGVPRRFALVPGLGYVFTMQDNVISTRRRLLRQVVARMYGAAFARCEVVFFQNKDDAEWFQSRNLISREKIKRVTGTGVDLAQWMPAPLTESPPVFLLIARLLREKGITDFVAAARLVRARHLKARFILIGGLDSNPSALSRSEVDAWVREGLIEWPGQVSDVRHWIAQASVYVLPSYREGVPRSTQEAMAMGRAVITTDAIGCRETVDDGVNGFLVPVKDPAALAAAMERFFQEPQLIRIMGRESRRLASERFDVNRINAVILTAMGM